jgi:CelD/BcsL family acetyltransferase involved in cellulose biosynthesis
MAIAWESDRRAFNSGGAAQQRPVGSNRRVSQRPSLAESPEQAARLPPSERCVSITTERAFYRLESAWRELYARAADASPFRSWDFTVEWYRHFVLGRIGGATGRFEIVVAKDRQGRLIGAVPMFEERALGAAAFGSVLQPFGRGQSFETMTDEPISLLRRGCEEEAARAITDHVARQLTTGGWDVAVVSGLPHQGAKGRPSLVWSRPFESVEVIRPTSGAIALPLPRSWESFTSGLSKSMRDNIAYYPRRLSREIGAWTIRTARRPDEVAVASEELIDLHRRRSRAGTGISHRNHIPGATEEAFLRGWFGRAAARDEISIVSIEIAGEAIAAQAFVEMPGCVSVYYSGYDERYYRYSPLMIITAHRIRSAIEQGVQRFDFPPVPTAWKSRWGAEGGALSDEASIYATRVSALLRGLSRRLHFRFGGGRAI